MANRRQQFEQGRIAGSRLDDERALADGRQQLLGGEHLRRPLRQAKPLQAGLGEHGRVVFALVHFSNTRIHVAANVYGLDVGTQREELHGPAAAAGANPRSRGQFRERLAIT